jgi:predicted RecA/RadA family phage recombinase
MKTIQLQGIGKLPATEAANIKAGDVLVWNFGETELVVSIEKQTAQSIWVEITSQNGYHGTRRMMKKRLVAIKN